MIMVCHNNCTDAANSAATPQQLTGLFEQYFAKIEAQTWNMRRYRQRPWLHAECWGQRLYYPQR